MDGGPAVSQEDRSRAQEYLLGTKILGTFEELLNEACRVHPRDLFGYLSTELWHGCQPAVISKWTAREIMCADGTTAVSVDVSAHHRGTCLVRGTAAVPLVRSIAVATPQASKGGDDIEDDFSGVDFTLFCDALTQATAESKMEDLGTVEDALLKLGEDVMAESLMKGARYAASLAALAASANVRNVPLYQAFALIAGVSTPSAPAPLISAVSPLGSHGKCMVRDLWVGAPTGVTGSDAQMYLVKFHAALQAAAGKKVVSDGNPRLIGGVVPPKIDKVEHALDLIREASHAVSKQSAARIVIDVGAGAHWTQTKTGGKYELEKKNAKTPPELVRDFLALAKSRPEILGFIDPLSSIHLAELAELAAGLADTGQFVSITHSSLECKAPDDGKTAPTDENDATDAPAPLTAYGATIFGGAAKSVSDLAATVCGKAVGGGVLCYSVVHGSRLWTSHAIDLAAGAGAQYVHIGPLFGSGAVLLDRLRVVGDDISADRASS